MGSAVVVAMDPGGFMESAIDVVEDDGDDDDDDDNDDDVTIEEPARASVARMLAMEPSRREVG